MAVGKLTSTRIKVADSLEAINELLYERGKSDGLPVIPPTPERVEAMCAAVARDPQELVALIPPSHGGATVEKIAINAVMAGCLPSYLPVVIAVVEAIAEPQFGLSRVQATTNPVGPMLIINGPIRKKLGINCGHNALGQGERSNATIGRAIRLIMINIGGGIPGVTDMSTMGQPGKFTCCFGENEESNPWQPLHVERGFPPEASTVTAVTAVSIINMLDMDSKDAEGLLTTIAGSLVGQGIYNMTNFPAEPVIVLSPDHAEILARDGLSKDAVRQRLWAKAAVPLASFSRGQVEAMIKRKRAVVDGMVHIAEKPEHIAIVVAGGAGPHSVFVPTFGAFSVTKEIKA